MRTKAIPTDACGASDAQSEDAQYYFGDTCREDYTSNHEDSLRISRRPDSHQRCRSRSRYSHSRYDHQHHHSRKSVSPSHRRKRSRGKYERQYRHSRCVSPSNRRERSRSRCDSRYRHSRSHSRSLSSSNRRGRSRSRCDSRYRHSRNVSPFSRRMRERGERSRSRCNSQDYHHRYNYQHNYFQTSMSPSSRRERSRSRHDSRNKSPYRYSPQSVSASSRREQSALKKKRKKRKKKKKQSALKLAHSRDLELIFCEPDFSPASTRIYKDLGEKSVFNSSTTAGSPTSSVPWKSSKHSVSKLLLDGHQRGEVDGNKLHKTLVLSTASSLQKMDSCNLSQVPEAFEGFGVTNNLGHMTHMMMNKDQRQLLCMWSVHGTGLQQGQVLCIKNQPRTQLGDLPLHFCLSGCVFRSFCSISSLCWGDVPCYTDRSVILYTTNSADGHAKRSAASIVMMGLTSSQFHYGDYVLGSRSVWACTWNAGKPQFATGQDQECQVIDAFTRQCWQFGIDCGRALCLEFSKADGGSCLYSGVSRGVVLMHDMRRQSRPTAVYMTHSYGKRQNSICDLKLSPNDHYMYTSDISGQISKWDLRTRKIVLTYEDLCNNGRRLPFHIDDSNSVLYAAGTDCYTKLWRLDNGELLCSIPPPYQPCPFTVPAVQFSSHWAGELGNMGLIMGANQDLHVYSSGV